MHDCSVGLLIDYASINLQPGPYLEQILARTNQSENKLFFFIPTLAASKAA